MGAAWAELDGTSVRSGKRTFIALRALLRFSRNDYWEMFGLRQRIARH